MNSKTVSLAVLLTTSFMLMLMASYLSNIQSWLTFNQGSQQGHLNQLVMPLGVPNGIGAISSVSESVPKFLPPPYDTLSLDESHIEAFHEPNVNASSDNILTTNRGMMSKSIGGEKKSVLAPVFLQYDDAFVIEVPKKIATTSNLKRMIHRVLLSPSEITNSSLLSADAIKTRYKPLLYRQVLNQHGRPIRYPADASAYSNYLLQHHTTEVSDGEGTFVLIQIPRVENRVLTKIERYKPWVEQYATQFDVAKDLVFAIIEVESAFNPRAVSKSNALGLMQLKASAAGRDVYQYVDGRVGQPTQEALFDAQNNLRMGIAYMGLLKHDYLLGVRNPKIKEMLAISSYNAGISRTLKLFAPTPEEAISRVNQLHPKRVYRTLRYEHASSEARQYLDKVLSAKKRYSDLLS